MSEFKQPSFQQPIQPRNNMPAKEQNGLGLTGFIISLVGLILCGIPSVIGLVFSAFGMRKEPKGFAIAGLILGFLGLLELVGVGFFAYSAYQLGQTATAEFKKIATSAQMQSEAVQIGTEWEKTGTIPNQEEGTELLGEATDMFENEILYETDGASFTLRSAGPDGQLQTDDDITAGPYDSATSATEYRFEEYDFEGELEEEMFSD